MSLRMALFLVLVVWVVGAALLPLQGMIHFLLVLALILVIVDRVGR